MTPFLRGRAWLGYTRESSHHSQSGSGWMPTQSQIASMYGVLYHSVSSRGSCDGSTAGRFFWRGTKVRNNYLLPEGKEGRWRWPHRSSDPLVAQKRNSRRSSKRFRYPQPRLTSLDSFLFQMIYPVIPVGGHPITRAFPSTILPSSLSISISSLAAQIVTNTTTARYSRIRRKCPEVYRC